MKKNGIIILILVAIITICMCFSSCTTNECSVKYHTSKGAKGFLKYATNTEHFSIGDTVIGTEVDFFLKEPVIIDTIICN